MPIDSKVQVHNPAWVATEVAPQLIGRNQELAEIAAALRLRQLVTLVGSGGIGKTSLAMAVAYAVADQFADGVYVVPLAEVASYELLVMTLAKALGLRLQPAQPWAEQLAAHVQGKSMLLVLDNFEQLLDWVEPISQMSRASRGVKFLVTSREKLGIPMEHAIVLQGMSLATQDSAQTSFSSSELLFLHYARRVRPAFKLAGADREQVQRICKLVDGMPLAIELAAAWVSLLPCKFIADQIQQNMDWLTTSVGITHGQQKSVRAVLDYFWGMLSVDERTCLQRLSVFSGGFERDMAQEIAGASVFFLSALTDRAYLSRTDAGRYFMHEMLKQFAAEKLNRSPDQKTAHQKQANAYLALAERMCKNVDGPEHAQQLTRFELEHNNFRHVLAWLLSQENSAEHARKLSHALMALWYENGHITEGRQWISRAIAASGEETAALANTLCSLTFLAAAQEDYDEAKRAGTRALALSKRLNNEAIISLALHELAYNEARSGHFDEAIPLYDQHLALARASGSTSQVAIALHNIAVAYDGKGDWQRAAGHFRESIAIGHQRNDDLGCAYSVAKLVLVCLKLGRADETLPELAQALAVFARTDDVTGATSALRSTVALLEKRSETDLSPDTMMIAVQLWACTQQVQRNHQIKMGPGQVRQFSAAIEQLRQRLGSEPFESAKLRGEAMSLTQGLQLAHQQIALLLA